jgi:hypothetical protein
MTHRAFVFFPQDGYLVYVNVDQITHWSKISDGKTIISFCSNQSIYVDAPIEEVSKAIFKATNTILADA